MHADKFLLIVKAVQVAFLFRINFKSNEPLILVGLHSLHFDLSRFVAMVEPHFLDGIDLLLCIVGDAVSSILITFVADERPLYSAQLVSWQQHLVFNTVGQ